MGKVITVINQKGGVGKTTTVLALATGLAKRGYKVLALDLDHQGNLSFSCGYENFPEELSLYHVFKGSKTIEDVIVKTDKGFDLAAGGLMFASADMDFTHTGREYMLWEALGAVVDEYDFVLIDTHPDLGIINTNALTASSEAIIPIAAAVYSLLGLSQLMGLIERVQKYCNKNLKIGGVVITRYKDRASSNSRISEETRVVSEHTKVPLYNTRIRESDGVESSQQASGDIFKDSARSNAAVDYAEFIDEFLRREGYGREK